MAGALALAGVASGAVGALTYEGCLTGEYESSGAAATAKGEGAMQSLACAGVPLISSGGIGTGMNSPQAMAIGPNGKSIYFVAAGDDAIAHVRRRRSGALDLLECFTGDSQIVATAKRGTFTGPCEAIPDANPGGNESALFDARGLTISPDGTSVYALGDENDSLVHFEANPRSGRLSYKGCLTANLALGPAGTGACNLIPTASVNAFDSGFKASQVGVVSDRGDWLYATSASDSAIARFKRNARSGRLRFVDCLTAESETGPAGTDACEAMPGIAPDGVDSGFDSPREVALSADGKSLYVGANADDSVMHFAVKRDGRLVRKRCVSGELASAGDCALIATATGNGAGSGLDSPRGLALSPDGRSLYVAARDDSAIAHLARNPRTGKVAFKGCLSGDTTTGPGFTDACGLIPSATFQGIGSGLIGSGIAASADGRSVYALSESDGIARLNRRRGGALAYRGCFTGDSDLSAVCTPIASAAPGGADSGVDNAAALAVSPNDSDLYLIASSDDAVARFSRETR